MGFGVSAETEASGRPHGFLAGVSFLTRIPVPAAIGERDVAASVAWFPVVGALVGLASGAVYFGASNLWSPVISATLAVATSIVITGAFHEDGLGDTADALGEASTGRDPQSALKDPRMGAFGVVALVLDIGLRVACVAALTPRAGALASIGAHALARGVSAGALVSAPSAPTGLGSSYAALAPRWRGVVAAIVGALIASACLGIAGPLALFLSALLAMFVVGWAVRALGAVSGDVLGAIEQLGEITTLLVVVALIGQGVAPPLS
jgi:adenosylcobinamide-GDP ribazoletransferase